MTAGTWPRVDAQRLLCIGDGIRDRLFSELPELLHPGDVLVLNDAATLPASLRGDGVEVRLLGFDRAEGWSAVLLGEGDWRTDTDCRPEPPTDEVIRLGDLTATVLERDPRIPRRVRLSFDRSGAALWETLYRQGRPVQYSYLDDELPLAAVQTCYATRPWAAEMPSAGRPLTWSMLGSLRERGVVVATLTHAAGLSATGSPELDALLPLPETCDIPQRTVDAIGSARRVIAVGTSVVRALEGTVQRHGRLVAGEDVTDLVIDQHHRLRIVDVLLSGMHAPSESHFRLHQAFAETERLLAAYEHAVAQGYRAHEFGDSLWVSASLHWRPQQTKLP